MLNEPTIDKLYNLKLAAMAEAWLEQQSQPDMTELGFDERFGLIVDAQHHATHNRKVSLRLKQARLRIPNACLEDVRTGPRYGVTKALVRELATCNWVERFQRVLITGATGVGKSYLASALGQAACRKEFRVSYRRVPRLFEELALARADGTYSKTLTGLLKVDLLILDDLGLALPREAQRHDLLEVLEDRYDRKATIVTSQLPTKKWHDWIGEATLADAIMDRLVHGAYKIELKGPSRRKEDPKNEQ